MNVPMLIVTADRPPELHGCGANQTVAQEPILNPVTRYCYTASVPESSADALSLHWTHMVTACEQAQKGPVHINMPFREPLLTTQLTSYHYETDRVLPHQQAVYTKANSAGPEWPIKEKKKDVECYVM